MKFLIFTKGPGETSQGYALTKYFLSRKHQIFIGLQQKVNISFFSTLKQSLKISFTPDPLSLTKLVKKIKPDGVILCNSKTFNKTNFIEKSPWPDIPTFSLDSNWLFNLDSPIFKFVKWAEKYFINFHPQIFNLGLKKNNGYFNISPQILDKIEIIGLIPSYNKPTKQQIRKTRKKLGVSDSEKLIFCYFSGYGAGAKPWVLDNLIPVVKQLNKEKKQIKVVCIGNPNSLKQLPNEEWFSMIEKKRVNIESFFQTLASSDLVFQHQGLGTLEQAISAQIPTIANVNKQNNPYYPRLHEEEIKPFAKLNLCRLLFKSTDTEIIKKNIQDLLNNQTEIKKMKDAQKKYYSKGEENLLKTIENFYDKR